MSTVKGFILMMNTAHGIRLVTQQRPQKSMAEGLGIRTQAGILELWDITEHSALAQSRQRNGYDWRFLDRLSRNHWSIGNSSALEGADPEFPDQEGRSRAATMESTSYTQPPQVPPLARTKAAQRRVSAGSFSCGDSPG
jgi:hypothetical protein